METHAESGFILINCQLQTTRQTPNKAKDDSELTGYTAAKPVRRRCRKKNRSQSALACSRKRHSRFLEKKLAVKPDLASPEEDHQDSDNSVCVKELENTSLAHGIINSDLVSSKNPTPSPAADPDLLNEQAILCEFLDTVNIDSDDSDEDVSSVNSVCSYWNIHPKKGEDLKRCLRCHITHYCSEQCQRKD